MTLSSPVKKQVLTLADAEVLTAFERQKVSPEQAESVEFVLNQWQAPWRPEALNHYLPLGWSFGLWSEPTGDLKGYLLAQPFLFVRGMTQSLWVEHLSYEDEFYLKELLDMAYRWSRDKHLQKLLVQFEDQQVEELLRVYGAEKISDSILEVKTSKIL